MISYMERGVTTGVSVAPTDTDDLPYISICPKPPLKYLYCLFFVWLIQMIVRQTQMTCPTFQSAPNHPSSRVRWFFLVVSRLVGLNSSKTNTNDPPNIPICPKPPLKQKYVVGSLVGCFHLGI